MVLEMVTKYKVRQLASGGPKARLTYKQEFEQYVKVLRELRERQNQLILSETTTGRMDILLLDKFFSDGNDCVKTVF